MTFLSPAFLWMLAALAPLTAAYFLKVRPRKYPVSALFLWKKIFQEKRTSSLFQRLRDLLSLLLAALALLLITLAAAGPRRPDADQRDLLLIVDVSPSMQAVSGGTSRLESARSRARDILRALNGTRRAAIATAGGSLRILGHASDVPKDLHDALSHITAGEVPVTAATIEAINAAARNSTDSARVVLLTDGDAGWQGLDPAVEVMRIGAGLPNAGIVAADLSWQPSRRGQAVFFYRIASSFPEACEVELELRHDEGGGIALIVPITLSPGEEASGTLEVADALPGRWTAALQFPGDLARQDALAADNDAALGLAEPQPLRVKVAAEPPYFFSRSVEAFAAAAIPLMQVSENEDLAIHTGAAGAEPRQLIFAPAGDSPWWRAGGGPLEVLTAAGKVPEHPLLRHLDVESIRFEGASSLTPAPDSLILAASETGAPLLWKSTLDGKEAIVVNLDPSRGEFFFSPWFPVLIHEAARHLGAREDALLSAYPTGTRLVSGSTVVGPDGSTSSTEAELLQRGHYRAEQPSGSQWFGAALFNRAESLLDGSGPADRHSPLERGHPPAVWLLALAIALLLGEFFLYHRRKAG